MACSQTCFQKYALVQPKLVDYLKPCRLNVGVLLRYQSQPVPLVSVEEVNQWVESSTKGHIPKFLEKIPHDVVLMLMNALYFKGEPTKEMTGHSRTARRGWLMID